MAGRYSRPTRGGRSTIRDHLAFLLLGLGAGAVYAVLGLGIVLVHRASGVVHVAHGATAMYIAYVFAELQETGDLVLPLGGLPARLHLVDEPTTAVAVTVALLVAALLGLLLHLLVFRPLRTAPALAKVVASVGVMVVLQAVAVLQFGSADRFVDPVLPNRPV
jgi:branched-chain amino acid transport system permease protein